jgi:hypothetical protein
MTQAMATPSTMLALGTPLPAFRLPDVVTGEEISSGALGANKPILVIILCRHCPYVVHVQSELARLGRDYLPKVEIVAISSNDATTYPDDAPSSLKAMSTSLGFAFPLCYDETQEVAKAFHAACTPEFYVFGPDRTLVYRGQLDDSRPGNGKPVTGADVRTALDAALAGRPVAGDQKASVGCSIKWKRGNAPAY